MIWRPMGGGGMGEKNPLARSSPSDLTMISPGTIVPNVITATTDGMGGVFRLAPLIGANSRGRNVGSVKFRTGVAMA